MSTEQQAMTSEQLRQAIDDSVLTHTGRSIGDVASQRVIEDIWPLIEAREAALVAVVRVVAEAGQERMFSAGGNDYATYVLPHKIGEQARALLASAEAGEQAQGEA